MDRKPSITITLSSDGEADDDDGMVVDEELRENAELWTKLEEKVIEDELEQEGMEDVLEVAKEDVIASLESEDNDIEAGDERATVGRENANQTELSEEETNTKSDDEREAKEDEEGAEETDIKKAKITMALVGKLANVMSNEKDKTLEEEREVMETNGAEEDAVEKESREDADAEKVAQDLLQSETSQVIRSPRLAITFAPPNYS